MKIERMLIPPTPRYYEKTSGRAETEKHETITSEAVTFDKEKDQKRDPGQGQQQASSQDSDTEARKKEKTGAEAEHHKSIDIIA